MIYALYDLRDVHAYSRSPAILTALAAEYEKRYMDDKPILWTQYDEPVNHYSGKIYGHEFWTIVPITLEEDK